MSWARRSASVLLETGRRGQAIFGPCHTFIWVIAGRPRGRIVLSNPNNLAILVCHSDSPNGLCRFTDSRIEVSCHIDNGRSIWLIQFTRTLRDGAAIASK
jgi:hypothetical protein